LFLVDIYHQWTLNSKSWIFASLLRFSPYIFLLDIFLPLIFARHLKNYLSKLKFIIFSLKPACFSLFSP
jgi:hypothetical protein